MCTDGVVREILERAGSCKVHGCADSYAASQSLLDNMILPSVTTDSMMYTSSEPAEKCTMGCDEVCSTVVSIVGSRANTGLVVHVVDRHGPDPHMLVQITEASRKSVTCVVVSMGDPRMQPGAQEVGVYTASAQGQVKMSEADAIRMVSAIARASETLIWYWTLDALGYAAVFNQGSTVHWAITLFPGTQLHTPLCGVEPDPNKSGHPMRVLPFFYTSHSSPTIAVTGKGFNATTHGDDLKVELLALSRLAAGRVYGSRASTGRCFCCQYIINLHERSHSEVVHQGHKRLTLRLEKGFQQRMKG